MLDNLPNLNELYAFLQVAQAGSFTKAADKMGVTSSALSQNVKNLENQLGIRLLNRTTRSISPTDAGEKLLAAVSAHFAAIVGGIRRLDDFKGGVQGVVRINSSELAANLILYPKLMPLLAKYPDLKLDIVIENRWVDIVEQGFDMGIRLGYALQQDMIAVKISEPVKMAVVAAPAYLAAAPKLKTIEDLPAHRLIGMRLSSEHGQDAWEFRRGGETVRFTPNAHFSANNSLRHQAALDGLGVAWLPKMTVQADIEDGLLVEVLGKHAMTYEPLYLYYPNREGHSRAFELVVETLKAQM